MDEDISRYHYFPTSYDEGRRWFRALVQDQAAHLTRFENPHAHGPAGEALTTELAWFGRRDAPRVFLSICGTHGQEYFAGAAGQLSWLSSDAPAALPDDVAVCLVHAHNPYGAAFVSRGNENFVDLNRNYFPPGKKVRPNPLVDALFNLLFTQEVDEHILDNVMGRFYTFAENNDTKAVMTAMGGGQDTHPKGILYCGTGDEWSTQTLRNIVESYLLHAQKVAVIDWHTGLGDYGTLTVLNDMPPHTDAYRWTCTWWAGPEGRDALIAPEDQPDYIGHVNKGVADDLHAHGIICAHVVMEFGTFDNQGVLAALMIDRWLRFECEDVNSPHAIEMRAKMLERLNPSMPGWRKAVVECSTDMYRRTIHGLSTWT
ncbi:MAG: DUF2817 domain-containing protein [Pseudomonadota bacterium]